MRKKFSGFSSAINNGHQIWFLFPILHDYHSDWFGPRSVPTHGHKDVNAYFYQVRQHGQRQRR